MKNQRNSPSVIRIPWFWFPQSSDARKNLERLRFAVKARRCQGGEPTTYRRGTTGQRQTRGLIRDPCTHHPTRGTDTLALWDPETDVWHLDLFGTVPKTSGRPFNAGHPTRPGEAWIPAQRDEGDWGSARTRERESVVVWGRDLRTEAFFSVFLLGIFFVLCFPQKHCFRLFKREGGGKCFRGKEWWDQGFGSGRRLSPCLAEALPRRPLLLLLRSMRKFSDRLRWLKSLRRTGRRLRLISTCLSFLATLWKCDPLCLPPSPLSSPSTSCSLPSTRFRPSRLRIERAFEK